jgi:hypothetical protein
MTTLVNGLRLHTLNELKLVATDIHITKHYATMSDPISYMPWLVKEDNKMTDYEAIGFSIGYCETKDQEKVQKAWQYLLVLHTELQGWFGRTAKDLLEQGYNATNE